MILKVMFDYSPCEQFWNDSFRMLNGNAHDGYGDVKSVSDVGEL